MVKVLTPFHCNAIICEDLTKNSVFIKYYHGLIFLVGGAAQVDYPLGSKGGTPTLGWWHCPRRGARPFRERYVPPYLPLGALCEPSVISFGVWFIGSSGRGFVGLLYLIHCLRNTGGLAHILVVILGYNSSSCILLGKYWIAWFAYVSSCLVVVIYIRRCRSGKFVVLGSPL